MNTGNTPVTDDRLRDRVHVAAELLALSDRQLIHVAENQIVRGVLITHRFVSGAIVLVLLLALGFPYESTQSGIFPFDVRQQFRERVRSKEVQSATKAMLEAGLQSMIGAMSAVLAARTGIDTVVLRIRP